MIFYTPRLLKVLKKQLYMSPSTWHKVMNPLSIDLHTAHASQLFGVPYSVVTADQRAIAKRRMFGRSYGMQLNTIVKTKAGYIVMSETKGADGKRKRLSKPYKTRGEAQKRLNQIEYFRDHKND